ncbi:MAG: Probable secreted or membrane serine protease Rv0983 [uncultured Nocardioides sp.]|uniref:Probable secreted or membrane serine protease Rv0983 n=1 Tax=uncultured Nocardioides sp. TaxID=198441 RepID=A0A6J4N997_9ACTN|nr:MAG: Probable secreted or membrane serine protease Rv0983 [uncultured Nocardioides sp.]
MTGLAIAASRWSEDTAHDPRPQNTVRSQSALRRSTGEVATLGVMSSTPPPHDLASQAQPYATAPPSAPHHAWTSPPRTRRRAGLAGAVLVTSLVVGGGAGFWGAALWDQTLGDEQSASPSQGTTTSVVDQGDSPAVEGSVEDVAAQVLPSVVKIDVAGPEGTGSGSGIILSDDGTILTNNHVVEVAGESGQIAVNFADGSTAEATILGTDPLTDTAVIKAEDVDGLDAATIGRSENLDVGQGVVAVGSPFGLDATVTSGIVSALDRPVNVGSDSEGNSTTYPAIQTDAAINPGNSGGPLVDMTGAVVGINSSIRTAASSGGSGASGSIGLGFAIPIDEVMPIVDQMSAGEEPTHARLGLQVGNPDGSGPTGAVVSDVTPGSTAEEGGLAVGDVITRIGDQRISDADSLVATIRSYRPGDTVTVTWIREGEERSGEFVLDSDAE